MNEYTSSKIWHIAIAIHCEFAKDYASDGKKKIMRKGHSYSCKTSFVLYLIETFELNVTCK